MNIEKPYLRLTDFPKKEDVRPLPVLVKALAHIKRRYYREEDIDWANEQLKSVRQDITVQHIRNPFVLDVYETHARILLEHGDLPEFNQCQSVILSIVQGRSILSDEVFQNECDEERTNESLKQTKSAADEFLGYAILYGLVQRSWADIKKALARASSSDMAQPECAHAMQVLRAVTDHDYRTFFRLYQTAPHMSAYLMDFLVKRVRDDAYERIIAAYRPSLSAEQVRKWLLFQDLEEARRFLKGHGAVILQEQNATFSVDCKASKAMSKNQSSKHNLI